MPELVNTALVLEAFNLQDNRAEGGTLCRYMWVVFLKMPRKPMSRECLLESAHYRSPIIIAQDSVVDAPLISDVK